MALETPQSEVDICNLALDHLKQRPIVSLDPTTTDTEELCARWYPQIRRACLRKHPWNFAMGRKQITPSGDYTPEFGFTHAYAKPIDFIRFIGFYDDLGNRASVEDYDLENDYILRNGSDGVAINIRYIKDITNVEKFDPLFIDFFALEMAIRFAPKFSGGEARVKTLIALQKESMAQATAIDGQERPPRRVERSKFRQARRGNGRINEDGYWTRFD